jgi:hypothetical protein
MRSILVSFVVLCAFLSVSAADLGFSVNTSKAQTNVYSGKIMYIPEKALVLDTETGRMWQLIEVRVEDGPNVYILKPILYENAAGKKTGAYPDPQ